MSTSMMTKASSRPCFNHRKKLKVMRILLLKISCPKMKRRKRNSRKSE